MKTLAEIHLADNDRAAVERATAILRRQFPVERVILFGSKARGDDKLDSDIDLLVLTSRPLDGRQRRAVIEALFDLQLELDVLLSPVIKEAEEWEHGMSQALPLRKEVDRDGVLL
jgi:predicted nucleotidyltransferase